MCYLEVHTVNVSILRSDHILSEFSELSCIYIYSVPFSQFLPLPILSGSHAHTHTHARAHTRTAVTNQAKVKPDEVEATVDGSVPVKQLMRRKSCLPQDFETTKALQQYHTVDKVLPTSTET